MEFPSLPGQAEPSAASEPAASAPATSDPTAVARRRPALRPLVRRGAQRGGLFAAGVAATIVGLLLYGAIVPSNQLTRDDVNGAIASALASVTPPPAYAEVVYQEIAPSFVIVQATGVQEAAASPAAPAGPSASAAPASTTENVLGSGVIVDSSGAILTALHVVNGASSITVTFSDGTKSPASVSSTQPANDIAVLQASKPPATITPATLGSPRSVQVGDDAFLVGNPFGLSGSMSAGVVSGFDRTFTEPSGQQLTGLIQFDAAVNPGNSGGPLLNRAGQVIGIVTGLVNPTGQDVFVGIGLAVPINIAGGAAGLPPD